MTDRHYYKSTIAWELPSIGVPKLNKAREALGGLVERETDDSRAMFGWTHVLSFPIKLSAEQERQLCLEYYKHV